MFQKKIKEELKVLITFNSSLIIKSIDNFLKEKINSKSFTKNNMDIVFYYQGKEVVFVILNYKMIYSKKIEDRINKIWGD